LPEKGKFLKKKGKKTEITGEDKISGEQSIKFSFFPFLLSPLLA
jgi:hypothetical protein